MCVCVGVWGVWGVWYVACSMCPVGLSFSTAVCVAAFHYFDSSSFNPSIRHPLIQ